MLHEIKHPRGAEASFCPQPGRKRRKRKAPPTRNTPTRDLTAADPAGRSFPSHPATRDLTAPFPPRPRASSRAQTKVPCRPSFTVWPRAQAKAPPPILLPPCSRETIAFPRPSLLRLSTARWRSGRWPGQPRRSGPARLPRGRWGS